MKRPDVEGQASTRPQVIFQSKEDMDASLHSFLTPNYPLDFNIDSCEFFHRGLGVDSLVRDAEGLDWAQDAQLVDACTGNVRNYQHVSPKSQGVADLPILVKSEFPFSGLCAMTSSESNANSSSSHFHSEQSHYFNYNDLDALAFHMCGGEHPSGDDSDTWAKSAGVQNFFSHDGISPEDDIGMYFHD